MKILTIPCVLLAALASGGAQETGPAEGVIRLEVSRVLIQATVLRGDQLVPDLKAANFTVKEEGRPQTIMEFLAEDTPVAVGVVIDNSSSMLFRRDAVVAAARSFVKQSNPADEMFILHFSDGLRYGLGRKAFTDDHHELGEAIDRLVPSGRTALYDAIGEGLEHLREAQLAKKALLVISDGGDNQSQRDDDDVIRLSREIGAVVYTIGLFDPMSDDNKPGILKRLAGETGGQFFEIDTGEAGEACARIAKELRSQYTLSVTPGDPSSGKFRRLEVQATDDNGKRLKVRARKGYQGPDSDPQ